MTGNVSEKGKKQDEIVLPAMIYGCETWLITNKQKQKLSVIKEVRKGHYFTSKDTSGEMKPSEITQE